MVNEQGEVLLHKGESVPLLFRYLSWEPKEKNIQIWIHQGNESSYIGIDLDIIPESSPIDHMFRYYQPEGRIVRLPVP